MLAQLDKSTWTRADVIKYLGRVLPRTGRDPAAAAALLEDVADRALRSEFGPVTCLEAPEPVQVPRSLLHADGRSVYQRHGGSRYATRAAGYGGANARPSPLRLRGQRWARSSGFATSVPAAIPQGKLSCSAAVRGCCPCPSMEAPRGTSRAGRASARCS